MVSSSKNIPMIITRESTALPDFNLHNTTQNIKMMLSVAGAEQKLQLEEPQIDSHPVRDFHLKCLDPNLKYE